MATRLELMRQATTKSTWDSVFLKNLPLEGYGGDSFVFQRAYKESDLVYICISTTGKAISQVPIKVGRVTEKGEKIPVSTNDPWQKLFRRPNVLTDRYSFVEMIVGFLMLEGNVWIVPFPPGMNPPLSLWVVRRKHIKPIRQPGTGQLFGWIYNPSDPNFEALGQITNVPPGSFTFKPEEVSHMWFWNPDDPIMGMAPLEAGKMSIITDYKAAKYNQVFFDKGAVPGGVLSTDYKLGDKQFQRVKQQFEEEHMGYKKAHRIALLEQGLKYTQIGLSQRDMQFDRLRKVSAERVLQIFGMKKAVVSVIEDVNYSTAQEERKEWWEGTNIPIMNLIASALNFTLFEDKSGGLECWFDISVVPVLQESMSKKLDSARLLWNMGYTANEINKRLSLGFEEKPWRDKWYMPVNLVPVDQDNPPETPEENPPSSPPSPPVEEEEFLIESEVGKLEKSWLFFIRRISPLEVSFSKKVSRVFFEIRKRTLELLFKKGINDVENDLFADDGDKLDSMLSPLYVSGIIEGVASLGEEMGFGISFDMGDPRAIQFLATKKLEIRGLLDTIRNQIRNQLMEGMAAGENLNQIADRLRNIFDIAKKRATTIARTEIVGAANFGRYAAIMDSGFRQKQWFTAMDERVRPQHREMHGKIINVGESWTFPDGSYVRYPGDYRGPAHQVINCRCIEVVVPGSRL